MAATRDSISADLESVVMQGDLSSLSPKDRLLYYKKVCESLGLNPLTRPFDYITKREKNSLKEKVTLYARREATEQLRKIHGISIKISSREMVEDVYVVTAQATDKHGRSDESIGAVDLSNAKGESKANAMMACETKAKRRVTLSICGLGMLDESEVYSVPGARTGLVDFETGELFQEKKMASKAQIDKLKDLVEISPHPIERIKEEYKKAGATCYADMTEEVAQKMINWLEPTPKAIQQGDKIA